MTNKTGQRVRALRDKLDITQAELAKRMGFVRNYISLVENGKADPSHRFIRELENIENAPPNSVLGAPRHDPFAASPRGHIKARRKELGLSLDDIAKLTGYKSSTIRNVEEGHTRASETLVRALATHLDLSFDELISGSDQPHYSGAGHTMGATPNVIGGPGVVPKVIPLLSWAQAGTSQAWDDIYEHEGFVAFNVKDAKAVAIQIRGDSMEPQYREGTIAIVYPNFEAKSGDLVIARLSDGNVMFKRLHVDGEHFTFISLNPIYPPITVEKSKVEKLLPVGGTFQSQSL